MKKKKKYTERNKYNKRRKYKRRKYTKRKYTKRKYSKRKYTKRKYTKRNILNPKQIGGSDEERKDLRLIIETSKKIEADEDGYTWEKFPELYSEFLDWGSSDDEEKDPATEALQKLLDLSQIFGMKLSDPDKKAIVYLKTALPNELNENQKDIADQIVQNLVTDQGEPPPVAPRPPPDPHVVSDTAGDTVNIVTGDDTGEALAEAEMRSKQKPPVVPVRKNDRVGVQVEPPPLPSTKIKIKKPDEKKPDEKEQDEEQGEKKQGEKPDKKEEKPFPPEYYEHLKKIRRERMREAEIMRRENRTYIKPIYDAGPVPDIPHILHVTRW